MTNATGNIALVLSGGGFRATLFHLGVVRYLAETGHLKRVTHICSVSGGSVLAAHVAVNWDAYAERPETFDDTARGLLDFVRRDVRGRIIRRWIAWRLALVPSVCRLLGQLGPLRFLVRFGEIGSLRRLLQREYDRLLGGRRLGDLGAAPDLHLLATSLTTGALASFSRAGFWLDERREFREISTERLPISLAVTASSAFPPLFPPIRVDNQLLTVRRDDLPYAHYLGDGGVYDNLGIHRLRLLAERDGLTFGTVVVSDAGARSDWVTDDPFTSPLTRNVRATDLLMSRVSHLDHESLRSGSWPNAVVVSLHDIVPRTSAPDALPPETQRSLATVRTDLDRFSDQEIRLLDRHGYEVAKYRLNAHGHPEPAEANAGETAAQRERGSPARLLRADDEPPLEDANRVRARAFSVTDWPSWLSLLLLACYAWLFLYYVGQPFLDRWRFQQYARAQTAGGGL